MKTLLQKEVIVTRNQDVGRKSEDFVAGFLERRGAKILARNYSVHNVGEIDIICAYKEKILVLEVKSRDYRERFGTPEEAVTPAKQKKVMLTAAAFCKEKGISLERVAYYAAGVTHDASGNILNVQFTPFF